MSSRAAVFALVAAALLPAAAGAGVSPDFEIDALGTAYPEFQRGLLKYGRHLRHAPRHAALLKHAHNLHHLHHVSLDLDADLDADAMSLDADAPPAAEMPAAEMPPAEVAAVAPPPAETPLTLPGRHPAVEKALDGMSGDLESLKEKKQAAKEIRGELEGQVLDAVRHTNDARSIKLAMRKEEARLRLENGKLKALEEDAGSLEQKKDSLESGLRQMIEPKLMFARKRFEKKEMILRKEEQAAKAWREKKDQLKASAMELIKQKKSSYQSLLEAEAEVAQAKKKEELARIRYEHDRTKTAEEVQSYRYAETRYKAELQHERNAKTNALAARESMEKLYNVENAEKEKVDQSIMYRKDRIGRKIHDVEVLREKSSQKMHELEQQYRDWQEKQRERSAEVMKKSQETVAASEAYQARQQQVLDNAQAKVVREAEAAGDWDGWGSDNGMFAKVTDEDDD